MRFSMCNWNGDKERHPLACVTLVQLANSKKGGHYFHPWSSAENHMVNEVHHHHHHHLFFALFWQYKNLFAALTARRRGNPRSHRAYGSATSLIIINQVKKKCCECCDYLIKNSVIFVSKLRRFDEQVTETGRAPKFRTLVENGKLLEIWTA